MRIAEEKVLKLAGVAINVIRYAIYVMPKIEIVRIKQFIKSQRTAISVRGGQIHFHFHKIKITITRNGATRYLDYHRKFVRCYIKANIVQRPYPHNFSSPHKKLNVLTRVLPTNALSPDAKQKQHMP